MKIYDVVLCLKSIVQINNLTTVCFGLVASQLHPLRRVETDTSFLSGNVLVTNQMASLIFL